MRIEHVSPSRCHEEFLRRCKENDEARHAAKVAGTPAPPCKRVPKGPRTTGFTLENVVMETMTAVPYDILKVRKNGRDRAGMSRLRLWAWIFHFAGVGACVLFMFFTIFLLQEGVL